MKIIQEAKRDLVPCEVCNGTGTLPDGFMCGVCHGDGRRMTKEPAVGLCDCGREVVLDAFTCPCDCGRDYNWAGQLLAPREQWGEETGEHWTECIGEGTL
jgi:hypothetical protein